MARVVGVIIFRVNMPSHDRIFNDCVLSTARNWSNTAMLEVSVFFSGPNIKKVHTSAPRQHLQLSRFPAVQAGCKAPGGTADSKSASGLALNFLATEP